MSYTAFNAAKPDASVGSRTDQFTNTRNNLTALMDLLAQIGQGYFFNTSIVTSSSDGPTLITYTNGTQVVKKAITYGSGVTAGLPVTIVLSKSTDSGSTYSSIATKTINHDGSGLVTGTTWS